MMALVCDRFGSLDELVYREVDDPVPGPDDVLVRVHASAAVFADILLVGGRYQTTPALPFIPGAEVAGEVIGLGANVTRWNVGDRIMSLAMNFGGFAEQIVLPEWLPSRVPDGVPYEQAAAVMSSAATAQHALRDKARLAAGEVLLVTGAAGGTGSAAIQVGKLLGARVIAVCSTPEKAAFCLELGADDAVVHLHENLRDRVRALTGGRGADVVFDTVGGALFDDCMRSTAMDGRILVVGFASGDFPTLPVNLALVKVFSVIGVHWMSFVQQHPARHEEHMRELCRWLGDGSFRPAVTAHFPLDSGKVALERIASRLVMGKVVVQM
ncbi:NADPH:quinone oxidoreductase family protein [Nocardia sp. R16R-3T]